MKVLALSGRLRAASINTMLLRAIARLAPADIHVSVFTGLGELPLFNPDLAERYPPTVVSLHQAVAAADALLFASPECAHGVTGTIKNALDWLVGFEPFASKVVAVLNTSPRAHHADDALRETLRTMAAVIVESASTSLRWQPHRLLPQQCASHCGKFSVRSCRSGVQWAQNSESDSRTIRGQLMQARSGWC